MTAEILITGFEPFGEHRRNPSAEMLGHCPATVAGWPVRTAVLPVSYRSAPERLRALLERQDWAAVVMLGLAGGATGWRIETLARNRNRDTPDNEGLALAGEAVLPGAPGMLTTGLPAVRICQALEARGVPASLSDDAGGYLCNHMFFHLMAWLQAHSPGTPGGFIHVPPLPADTDESSILAGHVKGLHGLLQALAGHLSGCGIP